MAEYTLYCSDVDTPKPIIIPPPDPVPGSGLPPGGTTGQVLTKKSDADGDVVWASGGGGSPVVIDTTLSTTSRNPVENRVITAALNGKASQASVDTLTTQVANKADKTDVPSPEPTADFDAFLATLFA